ncbi:glycosyltransferase [Dyadobacter sp. NIV53]|uniref:glycosyltransferase n=1 Tax=Dyadobacter sp. NIV53 TaxID=2861765 RepID=UPI001C88D13E|nr:glycosyltransferase [Dyadobacter sp. NIV53]
MSLHDTSPRLLNTQKQCVYCHNPSIFYKTNWSEFRYDKTHVLFSLLYKFLYRINQNSNRYIIVQQEWIRKKFNQQFDFPLSNIIVAYPNTKNNQENRIFFEERNTEHTVTFIYAAFPRIFKNYEVIVEAVKILLSRNIYNFQVKFTLNGEENRYAGKIKKISDGVEQIKFLGLMPRDEVMLHYLQSDVLIFPSKLETWGLPITEFKNIHKPILAAELEYAHETVGSYDKISFFEPTDSTILAEKMAAIIRNDTSIWQKVIKTDPEFPFTSSWDEMLEFILKN